LRRERASGRGMTALIFPRILFRGHHDSASKIELSETALYRFLEQIIQYSENIEYACFFRIYSILPFVAVLTN
jgi:hypothetical protein